MRSCRLRKSLLLLCSLGGLLSLSIWLLLRPSRCEVDTLDKICHAWKDGNVDGDWCFQLCEQTTQKSCHNLIHYGKLVVVRLRGAFGSAVAKSRFSTWSGEVEPPLRPLDPLDDFRQRVRLLIENIYPVSDAHQLWNRIPPTALSSSHQVSHLLQLLSQREFVWSFLFSRTRSPFPRVRGTCAHLFIVEEVDVDVGQVNDWPLVDRLSVAVKLVDLIIALDNLGVEMCDFKWEHFGIGLNWSTGLPPKSNGAQSTIWEQSTPTEAKLLDLDAVLSRPSLKLNMDNTPCESDQDCDYFDCKGHCIQPSFASSASDQNSLSAKHRSKPSCERSRQDSNLRRLLRMLAGSWLPPRKAFFRQLPPDAPPLRYISESCLDIASTVAGATEPFHTTHSHDPCDPQKLRKLLVEQLHQFGVTNIS